MADIPCLKLNNHQQMPLLGLGVYKAAADGEVENAVSWALEEGYRMIDTASAYKMRTVSDGQSALQASRGKNFLSRQNLE